MRRLDVLRHAMRRKPGAHLSREGIELARWVSERCGPYRLVVTSTIPRAVETAIAMGFEVDRTVEGIGNAPDEVLAETGWPSSFARIAEAVSSGGAAARFAEEQAGLWRQIVEQAPDGTHVLIVTHGLLIELGAVGSVPDADHGAWGGPIGYCEGIRLTYDGNSRHGELLRVPDELRMIEN